MKNIKVTAGVAGVPTAILRPSDVPMVVTAAYSVASEIYSIEAVN